MGYTHYWKAAKALKISPVQKALIQEVLAEGELILAGGDGEGKPEFTSKLLSLNGKGEDDSHETFLVYFGKKEEFAFCKTDLKPYDLAVCKLLLVLSLSEGFNFSSDGACDGSLTDGSWPNALVWFIQKGYADTVEKKILPYLNSER